jgi:hypothetical protein
MGMDTVKHSGDSGDTGSRNSPAFLCLLQIFDTTHRGKRYLRQTIEGPFFSVNIYTFRRFLHGVTVILYNRKVGHSSRTSVKKKGTQK